MKRALTVLALIAGIGAVAWLAQRSGSRAKPGDASDLNKVDEQGDESFPASDPPANY